MTAPLYGLAYAVLACLSFAASDAFFMAPSDVGYRALALGGLHALWTIAGSIQSAKA